MPFVLRGIRKRRWLASEDSDFSWLEEDEIQADALSDLTTQDNTLSVWLIEDDRSNLKQVITAMAANPDNWSNFDFALMEQRLLADIGIELKQTNGETADDTANAWHWDMVGLSASRLLALALVVKEHAQIERIEQKSIKELILSGMDSGQLNRQKNQRKTAQPTPVATFCFQTALAGRVNRRPG